MIAQINPDISIFPFRTGPLWEQGAAPKAVAAKLRLYSIAGSGQMTITKDSSTFIYVAAGQAFIDTSFLMLPGMYAVTRNSIIEATADAQVFLAECLGYSRPFLMGGPEKEFRDVNKTPEGCYYEVLIPPAYSGGPALIHQNYPPGFTYGTRKFPAARVGLVIAGSCKLVTKEGTTVIGEDTTEKMFVIHAYSEYTILAGAEGVEVIFLHHDWYEAPTNRGAIL